MDCNEEIKVKCLHCWLLRNKCIFIITSLLSDVWCAPSCIANVATITNRKIFLILNRNLLSLFLRFSNQLWWFSTITWKTARIYISVEVTWFLVVSYGGEYDELFRREKSSCTLPEKLRALRNMRTWKVKWKWKMKNEKASTYRTRYRYRTFAVDVRYKYSCCASRICSGGPTVRCTYPRRRRVSQSNIQNWP